MINNRIRLYTNKTDFIIIGKSKQCIKLTRFFPTPILNHSITPSDTLRNLGVTFDSEFNVRKYISLTCRSCFYHIRDLRRIRRHISLSVAKTIATTVITSRFNYCNSHIYNTPSKEKTSVYSELLSHRVVTRSPRFSHSVPLLKSRH